MGIDVIAALAADYLASNSMTLAGTASASAASVLKKLLHKRAEVAKEILIEELKLGTKFKEEISEDDAAATIFRYMRAAEEGAARRNLRFLAAITAGQAAGDGLYADQFLRWAAIVASLEREEIIILGVTYRIADKKAFEIARDGTFWSECLDAIEHEYGIQRAVADAHAGSLMRTGLLQILGGLFDIGHAYIPTNKLLELGRIVDIEGLSVRSDKLDGG